MKYYKRSASVEAVTFDELVQHGIDNGGNIVNGMPWSFKYNDLPITHENDNCYLIPSPTGGSLAFNRGDMLLTCGDKRLFPMSLPEFCAHYECDLVKTEIPNAKKIVGYISIITAHKLRSGANLCDISILQTKGKHHSVAVYFDSE